MRRALALVVLAAAGLAVSGGALAMDDKGRAAFVRSCETQMYMSNAACACMADIADDALDDVAVDYLSLAANDVVRSAALAKSMSPAEIAAVDRFMSTAPGQCREAI